MKGKNVPSLWCEQYQIEPPMSGPTWQQLDRESWPSVSPTGVISVGSNRGQNFHPTFLVTKKWNRQCRIVIAGTPIPHWNNVSGTIPTWQQ